MFLDSIQQALLNITNLNPELLNIVLRSLLLATTSTFVAAIVGISLGISIARSNFSGKRLIISLINTGMAFPTVVVGIVLYCILSKNGPLGIYSLLYTKIAIILGQIVLGLPIVIAITISSISHLDKNLFKLIDIFNARGSLKLFTILKEARFGIITAIVACFGRVIAEVGVSMILGGNIKEYTRTMTTAIALEHDKGELSLALALGIILLCISLGVNILFQHYKPHEREA
ncbi:MAG: ABC transporter permease [Pseudomonadota bacterium]